MNKAGEYALKGVVAGAILGAGLALITFHFPFIIGAAVVWGLFGGAIGAVMGAMTPEDKKPPELQASTFKVQSQCAEPAIEQGQCQQQDPKRYQNMVCNTRVAEVTEIPQR